MNWKRVYLWVTGAPAAEPPSPDTGFLLCPQLPANWQMTFVNPKKSTANFCVRTKCGPNFIHRTLQRWVLGIYWELLK